MCKRAQTLWIIWNLKEKLKVVDSSFIHNIVFFICYLAAPRITLGNHPMSISAFNQFQLEGQQELQNKVGSRSPVKHLVGIKPGTFWFYSNALTQQKMDKQQKIWRSNSHGTLFFLIIWMVKFKWCPLAKKSY